MVMNQKMPVTPTKVLWPVLICYENDPEMDLILSDEEWNNREDIRQLNFQPGDKVIDVTGQVFKPVTDQNSPGSLKKTQEKMKLEDLLGLIKAHMSESGACCVAKLYAPGYKEAFGIMIDSRKDEA